MKKTIIIAVFFALSRPALAFFPYFYGARSLALGYSSLAFNYDCNAVYLNPALLNLLSAPLGGYQYASSFLDHQDFSGLLQKISAFNLGDFQNLDLVKKNELWERLQEVFSLKSGINGFQLKNPGYVGKGYGLAVSFVDSAIIFPLDSDILAKPVEGVTNADIAALRMRFIGFHYTSYSFAFSFSLSQGVAIGGTVHYLKGRAGEFDLAISAAPFQPSAGAKEYLQYAWDAAQNDFSKLNFDLGINADLGSYFKVGLVVRNAANPLIATGVRELRLPRRVIAGLTFRPDSQWGISMDIDVTKSDLYYSGQKLQPVSLGVEKGFFQNKFFLRAGLLNDLGAKYFLGRNAKVIYGVGLGFNLASFLVDFAMGLDGMGHMKNLAVSGFYLIQ
ncbi:MAG: conjugal transfer protein TraF [Candidatus Aminicenantes bacterium]|nr:conjugal transfer protein TraF [Candidatus Aminicenantes bacterium]